MAIAMQNSSARKVLKVKTADPAKNLELPTNIHGVTIHNIAIFKKKWIFFVSFCFFIPFVRVSVWTLKKDGAMTTKRLVPYIQRHHIVQELRD
jgi:hypothetical protein